MDSVGKARLGICFLLALMVGGATVVLPTPALASERAMRVDTVPAPTGISVSSAGTGPIAKFAQLDVAPFEHGWRQLGGTGGRRGPGPDSVGREVEPMDGPRGRRRGRT